MIAGVLDEMQKRSGDLTAAEVGEQARVVAEGLAPGLNISYICSTIINRLRNLPYCART